MVLAVRAPALEFHDGFHLSPLAPGDEAALVHHLQDPEIARLSVRIPHPYSDRDAREWIRLSISRARLFHRPLVWAIRDPAGWLIGCVGFELPGPAPYHKAEVGYWLGKEYWGKGIATAALAGACKMGFERLGWVRISATVLTFNRASERVLEKCGFRLEGEHPKMFRRGENYLDARTYGLVA